MTARSSCCARSSHHRPGSWPPAPSGPATPPGGSTALTYPPTPKSQEWTRPAAPRLSPRSPLEVDNPRWRGVPFRLRTGKALVRRRAEILIHFRPAGQPTFAEAADVPANLLRFGLDPDRLTLRINLNGAGDPFRLEHATLKHVLAPQDLPAYGRLLLAVMDGDLTPSIRGDEAEECWRITEPILTAWAEGAVPLGEYPAGSAGPRILPDHGGERSR